MELIKDIIVYNRFQVSGLFLLPTLPNNPNSNKLAIFTHGYTAHKGDVLNWAHRLSFAGVTCAIFDLPGHYLGSYNEVEDFAEFSTNTHLLFLKTCEKLLELSGIKQCEFLILGGHSLGAFFALKALDILEFKTISKMMVGVGITTASKDETLFLESDFFKETLILREQLVSKSIRSHNLFPWIKERMTQIAPQNQTIHLITGEDDLISKKEATLDLSKRLENMGNTVTTSFPKTLPHHRPEMAAPFIYSHLKKQKLI